MTSSIPGRTAPPSPAATCPLGPSPSRGKLQARGGAPDGFRARLDAQAGGRRRGPGPSEPAAREALEATLLEARLRAEAPLRGVPAAPVAEPPGPTSARAAAVWAGLERLQVGHDARGADHVRVQVRGRGGALVEAELERAGRRITVTVGADDAHVAEGFAQAVERRFADAGIEGEVWRAPR